MHRMISEAEKFSQYFNALKAVSVIVYVYVSLYVFDFNRFFFTKSDDVKNISINNNSCLSFYFILSASYSFFSPHVLFHYSRFLPSFFSFYIRLFFTGIMLINILRKCVLIPTMFFINNKRANYNIRKRMRQNGKEKQEIRGGRLNAADKESHCGGISDGPAAK